MMNSLWIAKTGMTAQQTQLDVISHNLSNVSTTGFKRNNAVFEDLIYQNLRQVGANTTEQNQLPTGLHLGLGVRTVATSRNFTQGSLQETKNSLDVAINGNGFFEVTMPDGTIGYTRDGSFQVDAQGRVVTSSGLPVANGITVPQGATSISISADGVVSAIVAGNTQPQQLGSLAMSSFINPAGLEPVGQNLFKESAASGQPQQGTPGTNGLGFIKQGFLESSNINVVEELVNMIQTQRAYEMNSKAIQTSDQMLAKLSQL
jgi:flagellar basal-body rod protein FlgG